jgi:peptidyl-prolyl cis-trans isomerase D
MNVLKTMRNMAPLKFLLWIIVISFVAAMFTVWGTGGGSGSGGRTWLGEEYAVKVEGRIMPPAVFRLQYRFYVERIRQMLGDNFREDFVRGASKTVAEGMVRQLILADMAQAYGLTVGDEELAADIQRMYNFRDPKTEYPAMISRMGVTAEEFQDLLRYELLNQKLSDLLAASAYLSDEEIKRRYAEQNEGVKAMVAAVPAPSFLAKVIPASDADIRARFDRDPSKFSIPEKRAISYVFVSSSQIKNAMKIDDAQVKAYYDSHLSEFSIPSSQRRASHILIKMDETAPAKDVDAAQKKIQEIYAKAKSGADFAALAGEYSQDSSSTSGGDLGWFDRTRMVKPFADAVFDECKAVGDIVGPVRSQFGFHVVKLTGLGGATKPFDEVKAQVRQTLMLKDPAMTDKAKALYEDAEKAIGAASDEASLKAAAAKFDLKVVDVTNPFAKGEPISNFGAEPTIQDAVFKAPQGAWSEAIKARDGVVRFKVTSIVATHPAKVDEVKAKIAQEIRDERASDLARAAAQTLVPAAKDAASLEAAAKKDGFAVQQSGLLKASDPIPGAAKAPEVNKAMMAAGVGSVVGPLKAGNAWVVAVVTEHSAVDPKKFAEEKDSFARNQRDQSAQEVMDDYVKRRRAILDREKKVLFNQQLLDQMEPAGGRQAG